MTGAQAGKPLEERFWPRVEEDPSGCWLWTGHLDHSGYGKISANSKNTMVHRLAYELIVRKIPAGMEIDHLCKTRTCVNPAHLEVVTKAENTRRGDSQWGINYRKTHCIRGHPLTPDNLLSWDLKRGGRACVKCNRIHGKRYRDRQREKAKR